MVPWGVNPCTTTQSKGEGSEEGGRKETRIKSY